MVYDRRGNRGVYNSHKRGKGNIRRTIIKHYNCIIMYSGWILYNIYFIIYRYRG